MKKLTFYSVSLLSAILVMVALLAGGCSGPAGAAFGLAIPPDQAVVTVADVLASPGDFHGRSIVLRGVVSGQCSSLCEFFLREGVRTVTIFPQGFSLPRLKTGSRVTVLAKITSGEEQTVFSALGMTLE